MNSDEDEYDRILEDFNCHKMEKKQFMKLIQKKDAMIAMSTCLEDIEKEAALIKTEKCLRKNVTKNYFFMQDGKGIRVPSRDTVLLKLSL